mmetsp:Transcript_25981/g.60059  ORF Transcript_25981/g.60059 Transcript_25981/m.60059 type:complete len:208 (-) Transcript_25981:52-675(-)
MSVMGPLSAVSHSGCKGIEFGEPAAMDIPIPYGLLCPQHFAATGLHPSIAASDYSAKAECMDFNNAANCRRLVRTPSEVLANGWTTLIVANLPPYVTQEMLVERLIETGFAESFNFVYVPRVFSSGASRGYAFVNFESAGGAATLLSEWSGLRLWPTQTKGVYVGKADAQGLEALKALCHKQKLQRVKNPSFRPYFKQTPESTLLSF